MMPEQPRLVASLGLVALPTAMSVAGMFVSNTLHRWRATSIEARMQQVTAELVKIAVDAPGPDARTSWTGIAELSSIRLRLLGFEEHIVIEVVDCHHEALVLDEDDGADESDGLPFVDAVADRWASFRELRGRVMWAELAVYRTTAAGLPVRPTQREQ